MERTISNYQSEKGRKSGEDVCFDFSPDIIKKLFVIVVTQQESVQSMTRPANFPKWPRVCIPSRLIINKQ